MFWLLPTLESAGTGSIGNERKSMLGVKPSATDEVVRVTQKRGQIALTFDAGDGVDALPELLAALRDASVKCTFFLTGEWAKRYLNSAKQIATDGHEIGNHSWSHPDLTRLSDRDISWELKRADTEIRSFYGHSTRPLFRAPFGARNQRVLELPRHSDIAPSIGRSQAIRTLKLLQISNVRISALRDAKRVSHLITYFASSM